MSIPYSQDKPEIKSLILRALLIATSKNRLTTWEYVRETIGFNGDLFLRAIYL
ncbi:Uncharacterised protein [Vibrio cholerae]|nr:Uncharacterised protein [Vibrio cholerae]CSI54527.1 Uncharacterised protein [Vibrio cholerae]